MSKEIPHTQTPKAPGAASEKAKVKPQPNTSSDTLDAETLAWRSGVYASINCLINWHKVSKAECALDVKRSLLSSSRCTCTGTPACNSLVA